VLQELRRAYPKIDPVIEYLDTKRFPSDEHLLKMNNFLLSKYRGRKFDLVIVLDNAALELALGNREELFPGTPIVFAGINDFTPAMLAGQEKVTGVTEELDIENTLKMAIALHPKTTEIFVVTDNTISGRAERRQVEAALPHLPPGVRIEFASPATMAELVDNIKRLPTTAIILITGFATDKAGQSFSINEGARRLTQEAKVPVYIVHESRLGYGPMGGILLGGEEEGRRAGAIALQVLAGKDPAHIPVDTKSTARPMFDYRQLSRFQIPINALPPGSIVINRPESFYEKHKSLVLGTIAVLAVLAMVIIILIININKRKQAEKKLRTSEEHYRLLADNLKDVLWTMDLTYTLTYVSPSILPMTGYSPKEFISLGLRQIVLQAHHDVFGSSLPKLLAPEMPPFQTYEVEYRRKDNSIGWAEVTVTLMRDSRDVPIGMAGVTRDISERKRNDAALRESEERFRAIFQQAGVGVAQIDSITGAFMRVNKKYCDILGMTPEKLKATDFMAITHPDDLQSDLDNMQNLRDGLIRNFSVEKRYFRQDGTTIWAQLSVSPMWGEGESPTYHIAVAEDITARKRAEAKVLHQRDQLRTLTNRLTDVEERERKNLARELHDQVCQNLATINIALETLAIRAHRESLDQVLLRLADVSAVAEQTGEIARNIMENLRPTVLDHYGLETALRQLGSRYSRRTGIDLKILGEEVNPRLNPNIELTLFRIAQEALNNAAKHARASKVTLAKEVEQDTVRLVISDNGIGFDQSLVTKPKEGRGWGLMTMVERAKAVGGHCRIESQPGHGTRVVVEVPHGNQTGFKAD